MKPPARPYSWQRTAAAVALAVLVPVAVFWRGALLQGVFFQADLVVYYYPAYTYATRVLLSGVLPLWAPEMEGGQPFHAQWEPTLLYPIDAAFRLLLPIWWALDLSLVFHYALAAVAMFAYARRLSLSRPAALVSAAIYSVNGFMIAHLEHPNLIVGAAWLPMLLLAVEHGLGGRPLAGALGMGAVLGMTLLGGHPDLFLMGALLVGLMVLLHPLWGMVRARRVREVLPPAGMLAGGYLLGLGLAAAQLLPTLGLARIAWQRHGASVGFQDTWSLKPLQFLVQLLPDLYGRNGQDTYWGVAHYWEECTYVGALALALAVVGLLSRHRLSRFYGGIALLSAWLAMGTNSLAFSLLRQVPGFGTMRLPCRYMFLFDLSVAVLAGFGAHWLSRLERADERLRALWLRGLIVVLLGAGTLWLLRWWLNWDRFLGTVASRLSQMHRFHAADIAPLILQYARQLGLDVALLLVGLSLSVLLVLFAARGAGRQLIPWVAWVGVVTTLFLFGSGYHSVIPARLLSEEPFTVHAIRASAPDGPFRVLQWDSIRVHANVAVHRGWWPQDEHGYRQYIAALPGNYNLVWGLSSVRQEEWSALPLRHTRSLTSAILAKADRDGFAAVAAYLPWWNAAYVISQRPLQVAALTEQAADRTHLYRTKSQGKRAWVVHQVTIEPDESRLMQRLSTHPDGLTQSIALVASDPLPPPASIRQNNARTESTTLREGAGLTGEPTAESARITSHSSTRVRLEATAAQAGYVVLGESWAPGWRAWIDGRSAPILRANAVHRAVPVGTGRHRIEFRYEPADFRLGLYLTAAALAVLVALATAGCGARR